MKMLGFVTLIAFVAILVSFVNQVLLPVKFKAILPSNSKPDEKLIVLVTGASTGIGKDAAVALANQGYYVLATVRKESDGEKLLEIDVKKGKVVPIVLHIDDEKSRLEITERIEAEVNSGAKFVALVNNAGVSDMQLAEATPLSTCRWVYEVNFFGVVDLTQKLMPFIRASQGRVVTVSSLAGIVARPLSGVYSSSKFAIEGYTDSLRRELQDLGVSVSLILPGAVHTEMTTTKKTEVDPMTKIPDDLKEAYSSLLTSTLSRNKAKLKNMPKPNETTTPAIVDAIMNEYPKTRYPVAGYGPLSANTISIIASILPDRLADYILSKM